MPLSDSLHVRPGEGVRSALEAQRGHQLLFTTNPGLEDIAIDEFARRVAAAAPAAAMPIEAQPRPFRLAGHVWVRAPDGLDATAIARQMRSIHHVLCPLHGFALGNEPLAQIHAELLRLPIPALATAASFRVTTRRRGRHGFTSIDVQRAAGAALVAHYGRPVDLEHFALHVRVDVIDDFCLVSQQLTEAGLGRRFARAYRPRAALKAPVAYAMLHLAGLHTGGGALLDPFCGSGTILVEAAALNPELELFGSDLFAEAVAGAQANLAELGLAERVHIRQADARALGQHYPEGRFRAIVTNPPYGVHLGQRLDFRRFYYQFLVEAGKVLMPGGLLVMLAWKHGDLVRARRQHGGFAPRQVRVVETGDLYPRIFVLERRAAAPAAPSTATPDSPTIPRPGDPA